MLPSSNWGNAPPRFYYSSTLSYAPTCVSKSSSLSGALGDESLLATAPHLIASVGVGTGASATASPAALYSSYLVSQPLTTNAGATNTSLQLTAEDESGKQQAVELNKGPGGPVKLPRESEAAIGSGLETIVSESEMEPSALVRQDYVVSATASDPQPIPFSCSAGFSRAAPSQSWSTSSSVSYNQTISSFKGHSTQLGVTYAYQRPVRRYSANGQRDGLPLLAPEWDDDDDADGCTSREHPRGLAGMVDIESSLNDLPAYGPMSDYWRVDREIDLYLRSSLTGDRKSKAPAKGAPQVQPARLVPNNPNFANCAPYEDRGCTIELTKSTSSQKRELTKQRYIFDSATKAVKRRCSSGDNGEITESQPYQSQSRKKAKAIPPTTLESTAVKTQKKVKNTQHSPGKTTPQKPLIVAFPKPAIARRKLVREYLEQKARGANCVDVAAVDVSSSRELLN
ncbi:hypothetical protein BDN70DRAFT_929407 [Pholiota conissans]|uniref:Uncharacterized protein n=1 Tax=Pholiota conissans TaxID=109636 RepID=A0A9P5Z9D4_9AGAR|nr:hypothetical protein BDN70DRAFT_929407 [Pholiota conissans]